MRPLAQDLVCPEDRADIVAEGTLVVAASRMGLLVDIEDPEAGQQDGLEAVQASPTAVGNPTSYRCPAAGRIEPSGCS